MIREANSADEEGVRALYLAAFDASERELVAELAAELLRGQTPGALNLVAEEEGRVMGHVAFSPVWSVGGEVLGMILAPLAVGAEQQGRGIGGQLVRAGLRRIAAEGVAQVFVYGDPAYYGRFGFTSGQAVGHDPPYPLTHPDGWLGLRIAEGAGAPGPIRCVAPLCRPEFW